MCQVYHRRWLSSHMGSQCLLSSFKLVSAVCDKVDKLMVMKQVKNTVQYVHKSKKAKSVI